MATRTLIFIELNVGTRVLGMRDLKIHVLFLPTGMGRQICWPHSYKKGNHDYPDGITASPFYPVPSLLSGVRGNLPVITATDMGNISVPPCMQMKMVYHNVSMVLFQLPKSMSVVLLHLPDGSVGLSKVNLSKYLSTRAIGMCWIKNNLH